MVVPVQKKPIPGLISVTVHSVLHKPNEDRHLNNENITGVDDIDMNVDMDTGESVVIYFRIFSDIFIDFHKPIKLIPVNFLNLD